MIDDGRRSTSPPPAPVRPLAVLTALAGLLLTLTVAILPGLTLAGLTLTRLALPGLTLARRAGISAAPTCWPGERSARS